MGVSEDACFPGSAAVGREVLDGARRGLRVVPVADSFLRHVRFGRDGAETTTRSYAYSIAVFLRWCGRSGRTWQAGVEQIGLFMTWLAHAPAAPGQSRRGAARSRGGAGPGGTPGQRGTDRSPRDDPSCGR